MIFVFLLGVSSVFAEDYYWVGGSGIWSNLNSWRTASGQIPNEVPDGNDNVIFNENSFVTPNDTVYILTGNPTCLSMIWQNLQDTVVMMGGSNTSSFDIYGSVTMHPKVKNFYNGKIQFQSENPGNTITCAGTIFRGDIRFEGSGEWILQDTLFVFDTELWDTTVFYLYEDVAFNPIIYHVNGRLDANEQVIICRGFQSTGNKTREFDFESAQAYIIGNWVMNAQNLTFSGNQSYIYIGGIMDNLNGTTLQYYDIDVKPGDGTIRNTSIKTLHRKIHFLGGGTLRGENADGNEGSFSVDTLLFSGMTLLTDPPAEAFVLGPLHQIHYTRIDTVSGFFDVREGYYHRIDFNGFYRGTIMDGIPSRFSGKDNTIDTCYFFKQSGVLAGKNTVTGLIRFNTEGTIGGLIPFHNTIQHAVFSSNGYLEGSNDFDHLTLNTGYWYQIQADSLIIPGSIHSNTHVQNINKLEVVGDCNHGVSMLSSDYKPIQAIINYSGGPLSTDYLQIRDIKNIGQTMEIINGIDAGNNEGFDFNNSLQARDLYWVNGQGEWADNNHWALVSAGAGGNCPPTMLDNVFFDNGSGFSSEEDSVIVRNAHIHCNDMTWVNGLASEVYFVAYDTIIDSTFDATANTWIIDTTLSTLDTTALHIYGSLELDPQMHFNYGGDIHFESEQDDDYEIIDLLWNGGEYSLNNKVFFNGEGGMWKLKNDTKFVNINDSVFFRMGEFYVKDDTVDFLNFISEDTLPRKLSMLDKALFIVHQWNADAWKVNASYSATGDTLFFLDAGKSTVRLLGDLRVAAPPVGGCHMQTYGGELIYWNAEFGFEDQPIGVGSILKSESLCTYNLVDFYYAGCEAVGTGNIDTLTWKETSTASRLRNQFWINFVIAEGTDDVINNTQNIDTVFYFQQGMIEGYSNIGFLESRKNMSIRLINHIDTAYLMGNAEILGKNYFSQLKLFPNSRYRFQQENPSPNDTTFIEHDFIVEGLCDEPIRIQSDSTGTHAKIFYKALAPTNHDVTADYTSIRDISMIPFGTNVYAATNSVDLGNNENWDFLQTNNDIFYWIGGDGKWGDWQHWSWSSGGPPIPEGCVPREINTVVFDDNSFTKRDNVVMIDVKNAYCHNMYWIHDGADFKPMFYGADSTVLYVYGSMMLHDSMDYQYQGVVYFDQFNEPNNQPDTIYSHGQTFWNDVHLQGFDDHIILYDDMTLDFNSMAILYHDHSTFTLNGNHLSTGAYWSTIESERLMDMTNSTVTVQFNENRAWWVDGINYELLAGGSLIINNSSNGTVITEKGDYFKYHNITVNGLLDSLTNKGNVVDYNVVNFIGPVNLVSGLFNADTVLMNGINCAMFSKSNTNVVIVNGMNGSVNNFHNVNRCIVNKQAWIRGNNDFKYCVFFDDGYFLGQNLFDTLVLYPGQGDANSLGNWFYFQIDSVQTVYDSLYMRGNQCSNMNIATYPPNSPKDAWIRKDAGNNISCDYLNIYNVGAVSDSGLLFYAGLNSTPLPNPNDPPPGWIFDNAQGYISGFNGRTERFCLGESYVIDAGSFNGDPFTQYFWEGSQYSGDPQYEISESGTYHIRVQYSDECFVDDYIVIETDLPPVVKLDEGPYCEGDLITISVSPENQDYLYQWWNGATSATIEAQTAFTGGIFVSVTDPVNKCKATADQTILVKPTPKPEVALGNDVTLIFGDSISLDAGFGDYYEWSSDPIVNTSLPDQRKITVPGYPYPVEYHVYVEIDGCPADGYKIVDMFPPSKLGIPTAFSPNGDGVNDILYIEGTGFAKMDFRIFDRYGKMIFQTEDQTKGWDGTFAGKKQEMEVYTYYLKVIFEDHSFAEKSGNITLLR